ncbi:MAG: DUF4445 domain-containing protein [Desulfamplus sp.]|nr:DUF4445 domain-containing protein [Desulfamplus sp.]
MMIKSFVQYIEISEPQLGNNTADVERIKAVIKKITKQDAIFFPTTLANDLPQKLRQWDHKIKVVLFKNSLGWQIVDILKPDRDRALFGVAIDLGTTRIVLRLINLESGVSCGELSFDNPQVAIAPDVLARIHHARTKEGLIELKELVISEINNHIKKLSPKELVYLVAISGNSAMTHLFLGVDPTFLIREPYIPAINVPEPVAACEIGVDINARGVVYLFPNIGSYFGGDLISGILFCGLHKKDNPSIMVDVGTNAEVVVGYRDWLIACAGAAGPALEGGISDMGMAAKPGVIDRVKIDHLTGDVDVHTIEDKPAVGICGSGMIDLAAELFLSGMVDIRGQLVPEHCKDRYFEKDGVGYFCLVDNSSQKNLPNIELSQVEINSLTSSKAAMYSILQVIIEKIAGLKFDDLEKFYVAGTFGSFINPKSAISIGMLPDIPIDKFEVVGNSSLEGASKFLLNPDSFDEIEVIRQAITYIELNVNQEFMNIFSGAKFYPHTDASRFPSVKIKKTEN